MTVKKFKEYAKKNWPQFVEMVTDISKSDHGFFKNQKKNVSELISSIRIKVIDADSVDGMEDTLADLAGVKNVEDNHISSVKQALYRLTDCHDANGKQYFYDEIVVMSAEDFQNHLRLLV